MATETRYADSNTTVVAGATGITAAYGAPNGAYSTNTGNANWTERFGIGDPTNPLTSGATDHSVTVTLRKSASGGGGNPTCAVVLYDNGTAVRTLQAAVAVGDATTSLGPYTFTTAEVSNANNVQVQLEVVAVGGNPSSRRNVQVDAITVAFNTSAAVSTGTASGTHAWSGTSVGSAPSAGGLPALIGAPDSQVEEESHSYCPVVVDANGALYTITESVLAANNQPRAMKSTDGGETWTEQDAANRPGTDTGSIGDLESGWITQEPGYITFTWARSYPVYSRFRTSDHPTDPDTWEDNDREQVGTGTGSPQYMSHTSPTDQTYQWMFWADGTGISYCSRPYGADTTESSTQSLDATGGAPAAWLDAANTSHVLYKKSGQLHYKTLTSGGTLQGTSTRVDTNGVNAVAIPHARPVVYDASGDTVVTAIFANGSGQLRAVDIVNGTPGSEQTVTNGTVIINPGVTGGEGAVVTADVDGTTVHAFWGDGPTGDMMHSERPYGGSWTTPEILDDTLTTGVWWIYAQVIDHPGGSRVMGLRYSDGFDDVNETNAIYYNEYALAVAGAGSATGTHAWSGTSVGVRRNVSEWSSSVVETTLSGASLGDATGTHAWSGAAVGGHTAVGTASGAHVWSGSASGARASSGSSTGTHAWSGSAVGTTQRAGSSTGTHAWSGAAVGGHTAVGTASGAHAWSGSSVGGTVKQGTAAGGHSWLGVAAGGGVTLGTASGAHAWSGAAVGATAHKGTSTGTHGWAGSTTGRTFKQGTAAGGHAWHGIAAGGGVALGTASGTHAWSGSSVGTTEHRAAGSGAHAWSGVSAGTTQRSGAGDGGHAWAGSAVGFAPAVDGATGSSTGTHAWSGSAVGTTQRAGSSTGTHAGSGSAVGTTQRAGSSTGTHAWSGAAVGSSEASSSASGTHSWAGVASGTRVSAGDCTGSHSWAGASSGTTVHTGAAAGAHAWSGSATGQGVSAGSAAGTHAWSGVSSGARQPKGSPFGAHAWSGSASGGKPRTLGAATGAHAWSGSSVGRRDSRGEGAASLEWVGVSYGSTVSSGSASGDFAYAGISVGITGPAFHRVRDGSAAVAKYRGTAAVKPYSGTATARGVTE